MNHCKTLLGALLVPLAMNAALSPTLPPAMLQYAGTWEKNYAPDNENTMWYYSGWDVQGDNKLASWNPGASSTLLIGNGSLGACVGGTESHTLALNEKGIFEGKPEINDYKAYKNFGKVIIEAGSDNNQKFGNSYLQQLDLTTGVFSAIGYSATYDGTKPPVGAFEAFASYPDQVIAARYSSSKDGHLKFSVKWDTQNCVGGNVSAVQIDSRTADITFAGSLSGELVSYAARVRVIADDGSVNVSGSSVTVSDASAATVIIAGLSDYDSSSPTLLSGTSSLESVARARVTEAASKGWDNLHADHVADHSAQFGRMTLDIGDRDTSVPTGQLLDDYTAGTATAAQARNHEAMVFNYGRYLMIAGARPSDGTRGMDAPTNLQGIWGHDGMMWNCDIHTNINVQMNYWPAEVTGLGDSHLTLCNWIMNLSEKPYWRQLAVEHLTGRRNITDLDGTEWTTLMAMNPFGGGTSYDAGGRYNSAQAWLCSHLIQHYLYTRDEQYLSRALPVLWRACRFWVRNMDRKDTPDGSYIYEIPFENSPEQAAPTSEPATAHSQQLVTYLFKHTLALLESHPIAEATPEKIADLREKYEHLDNGMSYWTDGGVNYLREWKYADSFGQKNHRHLSHLVCMYPLDLAASAPDDVYESIVNAMHSRGYKRGDTDPAVWTTAWKVCLWARDHSQRAYEIYKSTIGHYQKASAGTGLYYNLTSHNQIIQMEGNWGLTAGVAEMLLQSHAGYLDFLPALPSAWPVGSVSGLRAIGNHGVDIEWADGVAEKVTVTSDSGEPVRLLRAFVDSRYIYVDGQLHSSPVQARSADGNEIVEIPVSVGSEVRITRKPDIQTGVAEIGSDADRHETGRHDLYGRAVGRDYRGIVIIRYSDGTAAKTLVR